MQTSNGVNQKGQIDAFFIIIVLVVMIFYFLLAAGGTGNKEIAKEPSSSFTQKTYQASLIQKSTPEKKTETQKIEEKVEEDRLPPKRFNPKPQGDLESSVRKIIISLETDEKAICRYGLVSGLSYDSMNNIFSNTNATSHSTQISTLSEGEKYTFYVKCMDEFGNKNSDDFEISFSVKKAEDKIPPLRKWLSPTGMLQASTTQVELTVSTDEKAHCYYSTLSGKDFWQASGNFISNETATFHTAQIFDLTSGKVYDYFVRCCDFFGNCNDGEVLIRFGIGVSP